MADQLLTALTQDTAPSPTDIVYTVKNPGGTPLDRKVAITDLVSSGAGFLGFGAGVTAPPSVGGWSWDNQGSSTITDNGNGTQTLLAPGGGAGTNSVGLYIAAPATPYTITACFLPDVFSEKQWHTGGLYWRNNSAAMVVHTYGPHADYNISWRVSKLNSPTSFNADYQVCGGIGRAYIWMRIKDDGVNRICYVSQDGITWIQFHSVSRTDFLTPTGVGWWVSSENTNTPNVNASYTLVSWKQT